MANEKSIFKYLICAKCGYKKTDTTGKGRGLCKNDQSLMYLSGNWYARTTHLGKTTVKAISSRKRDAEDYLATCRIAKRNGTLLPGEEKDISWPTAKENAEQWWKDAVLRKEIKQSTADYYKWQMIPLDNFFQGKSLLTITRGDVKDYQTKRSEDDIKPVTINHEIKALKRIYSMHVERTSSEIAPKLCGKAADIGRVALLPKSGKKARFLDEAEIKILLEKATTPEVKLLSILGLNTGLRKTNILGLTWQQVRLSKRIINLPAEVMKSGHDHTIDIPEHLIPVFEEWRGNNKLTRFLFPDCTGKSAIDTIRPEWDKTMIVCGFTDVTIHTLRHTFASQFLMTGGDLSTLSEILDHSSIQITKDLYGHLSRAHKRKATDQFATTFLNQFS